MKKTIYITIALVAVAGIFWLSACKKTNDYPSKVVTVSYPVVTLNGPLDTTIAKGSTWVDPGASWYDTVTGEKGTITFAINTSKDSAYFFQYVATNKNGFTNLYQGSGPPTRGVGVTEIGNNIDISGAYTQNGPLGPLPANLAKGSPGLFTVDNVDGFFDPGIIVIKSDSTISVATIQALGIYFQTYVTSAVVNTVFTQTSIFYQPAFVYTGNPPHVTAQSPVQITYNETPLNGPSIPISMSHN